MASLAQANFSGDEFERNARAVLRDDNETFVRLLKLRQQALADVLRFQTRATTAGNQLPSAAEMNETYNSFFARAEKLLGNEMYLRIFGAAVTAPPNIVDPEQVI